MSSELSPVERLKRRIYLIISSFSLVTSLIGITVYLNVTDTSSHTLVLSILALSALFHTGAIAGLLNRQTAFRQFEVPLIIMTALVIFTLLGHALYVDYPSQVALLTIMGMYLWLPVLYLFTFLAAEARLALNLSLGIFLFTLAFTVPHALATLPGTGMLDGFSALGNAYLSHGVLITGLYFLATFQKRLRRAIGEASYMQQLAYTDELTGTANRRQMEQLIHAEIIREQRYGRPFSIVLLDIDHFKRVNDSYGHDVGDWVLRQLSERIASTIRASDRVGRWGGEEFLILAPETDLREAAALAEHVREQVQAIKFHKGQTLTISLGVTSYRQSDNETSLVKRADEALYEAKQSGRNKVISRVKSLTSSHA